MNNDLNRRDFLKAATLGAAFPAALASGAAPSEKDLALAETIPVRTFGGTGVKLPVLAYGGAALPKEWHNPLSREDRVRLVRYG
ncbi:MAG: twin-arginine translocation signal domain-containing protein, partial [Victivallales bacterium]|nr:twin-arginine translocation signal domain-containing protein [Victivallales bacterium]